ncbi:hypothetical protein Tco_0880015 [Tanacetum coccineum]
MDYNPSQPSASTLVVVEMHKEDQQAVGGPTSLGVTSEEGANPQLSSGMSAFIHNKPIYSVSTIIHSESASGCDALANSIVEVDPKKSAPNDSISKQQDMDKGTKNYSVDHIFTGTNPHVLVEQTKVASKGLETVLTQPTTGKGASDIEKRLRKNSTLLVISTALRIHKRRSSWKTYPRWSSVKNQKKLKMHQIFKLKKEKIDTKVEVAFLSAQPSFPNVEQLIELLDLKEIPTKLEKFTAIVESLTTQVVELKTLQRELLAEFLFVPTQVIESASTKARDKGVPSAGPANTKPVKGENNTQQATIS